MGNNETTPLLPDSLLGEFTKASESRINETITVVEIHTVDVPGPSNCRANVLSHTTGALLSIVFLPSRQYLIWMICFIKEVMFQCITLKINCIIECYIFYFYMVYCFTFSVTHLIVSVTVITFVRIRRICTHVLKMLQALLHVYIVKIQF